MDRPGLKKGRAVLAPLLGRVEPDPDPSSMAVRGTKFKLSPMPIDVQRRVARMADVESRSKEVQGAGLYVEGEIPNRVLHQQHGEVATPPTGDHFDLPKDLSRTAELPLNQGGISSSDFELQKPNYRGKQYRASAPIPPGWEIRNDGREAGGNQSEGHYSLRPALDRSRATSLPTLEEAGRVNHAIFRQEIGMVEQKNRKRGERTSAYFPETGVFIEGADKKTKTFTPLSVGHIKPEPMAHAGPTSRLPDITGARSTTVSHGHTADSSTQTHFSNLHEGPARKG